MLPPNISVVDLLDRAVLIACCKQYEGCGFAVCSPSGQQLSPQPVPEDVCTGRHFIARTLVVAVFAVDGFAGLFRLCARRSAYRGPEVREDTIWTGRWFELPEYLEEYRQVIWEARLSYLA